MYEDCVVREELVRMPPVEEDADVDSHRYQGPKHLHTDRRRQDPAVDELYE
jgi:hypothetical protein